MKNQVCKTRDCQIPLDRHQNIFFGKGFNDEGFCIGCQAAQKKAKPMVNWTLPEIVEAMRYPRFEEPRVERGEQIIF